MQKRRSFGEVARKLKSSEDNDDVNITDLFFKKSENSKNVEAGTPPSEQVVKSLSP